MSVSLWRSKRKSLHITEQVTRISSFTFNYLQSKALAILLHLCQYRSKRSAIVGEERNCGVGGIGDWASQT